MGVGKGKGVEYLLFNIFIPTPKHAQFQAEYSKIDLGRPSSGAENFPDFVFPLGENL